MSVFSARWIGRDTWIISGEGADSYLMLGDEEALMIDAGCAKEDICAFAQTLTALPVRSVVNTHSHFDHTGGNGFFEKIYATPGIARSAKNAMDFPRASYRLDYECTLVNDGDILPLRGRPLEVIELDCHSPGDIVLLDRKHHLLFCGDEIEAGQVLLLPGYAEKTGQIHACAAAAVETYQKALEKIRKHQKEIEWLCPSHNGSPIAVTYIDWYDALCTKILDGLLVGKADCTSSTYGRSDLHYPYEGAGYLRASYLGASLVYNKRLLREKDREHADELPPATPLHCISAYQI